MSVNIARDFEAISNLADVIGRAHYYQYDDTSPMNRSDYDYADTTRKFSAAKKIESNRPVAIVAANDTSYSQLKTVLFNATSVKESYPLVLNCTGSENVTELSKRAGADVINVGSLSLKNVLSAGIAYAEAKNSSEIFFSSTDVVLMPEAIVAMGGLLKEADTGKGVAVFAPVLAYKGFFSQWLKRYIPRSAQSVRHGSNFGLRLDKTGNLAAKMHQIRNDVLITEADRCALAVNVVVALEEGEVIFSRDTEAAAISITESKTGSLRQAIAAMPYGQPQLDL